MRVGSAHAIARSDRVLLIALLVILAMASTMVGASMMPSVAPELVRTIRVERSIIKLVAMPPGPETVAANTAGHDAVLSELLTEHRCLAEVMYYEARGEGEEGEKAVAEVVFHRMAARDYGNSICAVVYEGAGQVACQFSIACDGSRKKEKSERAWRAAQLLAARVLTGEVMLRDETGGAVNSHAVYVRPRWARDFKRTAQIGNHVFYRMRGMRVSKAEVVLRGSTW